MNPKPTGRLRGDDLVITRTFEAPIADVWTSVTKSESTARWFGPWERIEGNDNRIRIQMVFEESKPWTEGTIEKCEEPRQLTIKTKMAHLSLLLSESAGTTTLELIHHDVDKKMVGDFGPGWEYYADNLVAARDGAELPKFTDYYPSQKAYFTALSP